MKTPRSILLLSWLVPSDWREAVVRDLEEEAYAKRGGQLWLARELLGVGLRMRVPSGTDAILVDVRQVVRSLSREKGFTTAAVLTLVLGIAVNLAVFTVVDRVLFRPLPFADIDRLVMVSPYSVERHSRFMSFTKALFIDGRKLPAVMAMGYGEFTNNHTVAGETGSAPLGLTEVSYNFLDVLGSRPVLGRGFMREDAEAPRGVAMITYETWRDRFGGAMSILGTELRSGKTVRVIVGVLPPGFQPPVISRPSARFDGLSVLPDTMEVAEPRSAVSPAVARLMPGVSLDVAQQQFDALTVRLAPELGRAAHRVLVEPLRPAMFWYGYRYLWLLSAGASVVGLLACVNLSNLLLARGRSRAQETAVRASLGASRGRLLVMEFVRSLAVCLLACSIALVLLYWLNHNLEAIMPGYFRLLMLRHIDARVAAFALLLVVTASLVAGGLPAWRATRTSLMAVMQQEGGQPAHARRHRMGQAVIACEAALGVVLVLAACMIVRNFVTLLTTDAGFTPANLYVLHVQPTGDRRGGDDLAELARYRGILEMVRRLPGVESAGAVDSMPAQGSAPMTGLEATPGGRFGLWQITDGFLETIGARLVAGRAVSAAEMGDGNAVAVVSVSAARRLWPDVPMDADVGRDLVAKAQPTRRIVGVIADLRARPDQPAEAMVFAPVRPDGLWFLDIAIRTRASSPPPNGEAIRRILAGPYGVTAATVSPAGASIRSSIEQPRTQALMFGTFAVIALLLAAHGLYAMTSFDVALRRYELGIRSSLGASAAMLRQVVVIDAVRPVLMGTAAGLVASYWISRWVQTLVYDVDSRNPWTFAFVAIVLIVTALVACWFPAQRAARIEPADVLRAQ